MTRTSSRSSQTATALVDRAKQIISYRTAGYSWSDIRAELGISKQRCHQILQEANMQDALREATVQGKIVNAKRKLQPGDRFGNRVILRLASVEPELWLARCKCGLEQELRRDRLETTTECFECAIKARQTDYSGEVHHWWKVIEPAPQRPGQSRGFYWRCECLGCGKIYERQIGHVRSGRTKSCVHCKGKFEH
ncbi:MAG: hypothetical protein F6J97_03800 [Leptolyngbya sp. SIO4C1]|nr:hypothetical protein [Leptolyngbya sp. SIO4C1]